MVTQSEPDLRPGPGGRRARLEALLEEGEEELESDSIISNIF